MSVSRSVSLATKWMVRNKQITSTSSSTRSIFSMFDKNNAGAKVVGAKKEESPIKKAAIPAVNTNVSSFNKKFSSTPTTETISKKDIVDAVAEMHELTNAKADRIVKQVFDMIAENVSENKRVTIHGFGSFDRCFSKERKVKNTLTKGMTITVPAKNRVRFRASVVLKDLVNQK
ncbi:hypothetical protein CTEN210_17030 [Chaetoceros tenuissimus]|uniref:Uncharacterized protein n=1 Tax=Chaetoceros tenuissimus TaxID=426638 RepID=A0AAD3DDB4_9STRA|nr:hypothetical protein CTEN210_17030 [Chaetoceros tenuissimus]